MREILCNRRAELDKVHRLGNVAVESGLETLVLHVGHDVGREGNHGNARHGVGEFPLADLAAGLVPVLAGHVEVALDEGLLVNDQNGKVRTATQLYMKKISPKITTHKNQRVVSPRLCEHLVHTLFAIIDQLNYNTNLVQISAHDFLVD